MRLDNSQGEKGPIEPPVLPQNTRQRRTKRACDRCHFWRTRCDGASPCQRCLDYGHTCGYNRAAKKRGRAPLKLRENGQNKGCTTRGPPSVTSLDLNSTQHSKQQGQHRVSTPAAVGFQSTYDDRSTDREISNPSSGCFADPGSVDGDRVPVQPLPSPDPGGDHPPFGHPCIEQSQRLCQDPAHRVYQGVGVDESYNSRDNATRVEDRPLSSAMIAQHHPHVHDARSQISASSDPYPGCRYSCLRPILPHLQDIISPSLACDLLDVYFTEPGSSFFSSSSSYVLTPIIRKNSLLHPTHPRPTTIALLSAMLWCSAQTADFVSLRLPGSRSKAVKALYDLSTSLMAERDPDNWRRTHGDFQLEHGSSQQPRPYLSVPHNITATNEPSGAVDDVLTFTLLAIAVSGGEFKSDSLKWWSKAVRLAFTLGLNIEDEPCSTDVSRSNPLLSSRQWLGIDSLPEFEAKEERRRVFWLLYCLDRHLALSHNVPLRIPDSSCEVFVPLPETIWENLDIIAPDELPRRVYGPSTIVTGTGFFEYFLPLMAILGDIIDVHRRRDHPRFGGLDDSATVAVIAGMLADCERSLGELAKQNELCIYDILNKPLQNANGSIQSTPPHRGATSDEPDRQHSGRGNTRRIVVAYSTHILHVLYVLLYGKWDAIAMLDNEDDWITSSQFAECASHAIAASQAVSSILNLDPELVFMPYLFGIYLLHGSFILLLFADRMPQLGPNPSVEQACETLIRAHEVCVVTLSTEFQKSFRKVLRWTLYSVRGHHPTNLEWPTARREALALYRWTKGGKGLAL